MARTRSSKTQKSKDINPKTAEQKAETGTKRKSIGKTSLEGKRRRIQKITKEQGRKETKVASTRGTRSKKAEVENKSEARVTSKKAAASAAPQFKSTVTWTVKTDFDPTILVLLSVGQFITVGGYRKKQEQWGNYCRLQQYDFQGKEVRSASLRNENENVWSMTEISLRGKACLAVAYNNTQTLDFRDVTNLEETVLNYEVKPHGLGVVCKASATKLLYEDFSVNPPDIRCLDCSASTPQPEGADVGVTHTKGGFLTAMCHTKHEDQDLLIATSWGYGSLYAYSMASDKMMWKFTGEVPGFGREMNALAVTADGRGHIFVYDRYNSCVQVVSVQGEYIGVALREGEHGIGVPMLLSWCDEISSLVVVHYKGNNVKMSAVKLEIA